MTRIIKKCSIKRFLLITILLYPLYLLANNYFSYVPIRVHIQKYSHPEIRIYCFILTSPKNFDTQARAINLTWAPRCDKFSFISEYSNDTKGLPIAPIANILSGRQHLTQKTTLALHYLYENFLNDYDWFVKTDDDTYLFVENLKSFLKEQNTSEPITFGCNFKSKIPNGYHSGGAGYVLSREAVKRFYQEHQKPNTTCRKDGNYEDIEIAECLRKTGVYPGKSVDKYNRERFHPGSFLQHFRGPIPDWLHIYAENKPVTGFNCCSNTTISFHYVIPDHQYLIDVLHYGFHSKA